MTGLVENNLLDFVAVGKAMISQDKWMEKARKDFMLKIDINTNKML